MFSGVFQDLEPAQIAALLSCLVFDEKVNEMNFQLKNEKLATMFANLVEHGKRIFKIYQDAKINIEEVSNNFLLIPRPNI